MKFLRKKKARTPEKPAFTLAIGRTYLVKGYWTGNFRARCCESLLRTAKFKVTDPMNSELRVDQEIEVAFAHADFLSTLIESFRKATERYRAGDDPLNTRGVNDGRAE